MWSIKAICCKRLQEIVATLVSTAVDPKELDAVVARLADAKHMRMIDGAEILVRANKGEPVTALAWNAKGTLLAFAAQDGDGGLLEL